MRTDGKSARPQRTSVGIHYSLFTDHHSRSAPWTPSSISSARSSPSRPRRFTRTPCARRFSCSSRRCPHVTADQDAFGNVIACYRGCCGHGASTRSPRTWIIRATWATSSSAACRRSGARTDATRDFGAFAMWDLPAFELKDGRIYSRACDDLVGCATILALFQRLERIGAEAHGLRPVHARGGSRLRRRDPSREVGPASARRDHRLARNAARTKAGSRAMGEGVDRARGRPHLASSTTPRPPRSRRSPRTRKSRTSASS